MGLVEEQSDRDMGLAEYQAETQRQSLKDNHAREGQLLTLLTHAMGAGDGVVPAPNALTNLVTGTANGNGGGHPFEQQQQPPPALGINSNEAALADGECVTGSRSSCTANRPPLTLVPLLLQNQKISMPIATAARLNATSAPQPPLASLVGAMKSKNRLRRACYPHTRTATNWSDGLYASIKPEPLARSRMCKVSTASKSVCQGKTTHNPSKKVR